ncbi:TRAP transporter small permease [Limnobacter humi]|uniref:TRAP transporter small permease protein n=1 Tax=Limnobacter humi TaxID=1778671 RepID=A0ABT1WCH0_9BURK|nr:TRAP transporter small permease [Limnobacter humi]MCQ8895213.1 TRAP transporter small permease [Limnobacter humi]
MSHGFEMKPAQVAEIEPGMPAFLMPLARLMLWVNKAMVMLGMLGLLAASIILTYSVVGRFLFNLSTDWQDEAAVFCLVGATFLTGSFVQSLRGHIGIEAVAGILPKGVNKFRFALIDLFSLAFCAFFTWKSWTLFHEAWVDGQTTSSTWAPPLWIPYILMSLGMTLVSIQLALQSVARVRVLFLGAGK